jgi:hypothetical protein
MARATQEVPLLVWQLSPNDVTWQFRWRHWTKTAVEGLALARAFGKSPAQPSPEKSMGLDERKACPAWPIYGDNCTIDEPR